MNKSIPQTTVCFWDDIGDGEGIFDTECGETFMTIEGTLAENKLRFCPFCGRPIEMKGSKA